MACQEVAFTYPYDHEGENAGWGLLCTNAGVMLRWTFTSYDGANLFCRLCSKHFVVDPRGLTHEGDVKELYDKIRRWEGRREGTGRLYE